MDKGKKNVDKKPKILIVDDAKFNRDILKEILGDAYNYLEAENGNQVIQMIGDNPGINRQPPIFWYGDELKYALAYLPYLCLTCIIGNVYIKKTCAILTSDIYREK